MNQKVICQLFYLKIIIIKNTISLFINIIPVFILKEFKIHYYDE
jgi:hypothetical protein